MNWEAIGAISDFLAAIAVIATLGYVAVQIRQNTAALRSAATQGAHDQSASVYDLLASDPKLSDIFVRGSEAPDALDRVETGQFYAFLMATYLEHEVFLAERDPQYHPLGVRREEPGGRRS